MRNSALAMAIAFVSVNAFAHIEEGTYVGKTPQGEACSMIGGKQFFENDMHHPLNERIVVTVDAQEFIVYHPPVVNAAEGKEMAFFNHDAFQGLVPTKTGAKAIVVDMLHTPEFEGPSAFHVVEHAWKNNERKITHCLNIKRSK